MLYDVLSNPASITADRFLTIISKILNDYDPDLNESENSIRSIFHENDKDTIQILTVLTLLATSPVLSNIIATSGGSVLYAVNTDNEDLFNMIRFFYVLVLKTTHN